MKACSRCGKTYPATKEYFVTSKTCRGGISGWCKPCGNANHNDFRRRNRKRLAKRRRELYAGKYGERARQKERERALREPYRVRASCLRGGMMERASRGVPFDREYFTKARIVEMLVATPLCPCCGVAFDFARKGDGRKNDRSPSIDRIVPSSGYVRGNVALLCWRCNNLKRDATPAELEAVARWMRKQPVTWGLEAPAGKGGGCRP